MSLAVLKISGNIWRVATSTYNILQHLTTSSVPSPPSLSLHGSAPCCTDHFWGPALFGRGCKQRPHLPTRQARTSHAAVVHSPTAQWYTTTMAPRLRALATASWQGSSLILLENNLWQTYLYCMCIYKCIIYIYAFIYTVSRNHCIVPLFARLGLNMADHEWYLDICVICHHLPSNMYPFRRVSLSSYPAASSGKQDTSFGAKSGCSAKRSYWPWHWWWFP